MSMLCTLSDVKTLLNISADDMTQDEKLSLLIKIYSAKIEAYLGYTLTRGEYTEELHSVNNRQLLQLNHLPIQSVTEVTANGSVIDDYKILPEYSRWGLLYRGDGWTGAYYTRGFTQDVVSGAWEIEATYTAGYYLPSDEGYVEGADDSLPYDISSVCAELVVLKYNYDKMGAVGLKSHHEGNISDTFGDASSDVGLTASAMRALDKYVFVGLA